MRRTTKPTLGFLAILLGFSLHSFLCVNFASGSELVRLDEDNYSDYVPSGKEVDAIIGDYVLSNEQIVAVIAQPIPGRNSNMTVRNVGGCLIDLTSRDNSNDQISAFYPQRGAYPLRAIAEETLDVLAKLHYGIGGSKSLVIHSQPAEGQAEVSVMYTLDDTASSLLVTTTFHNPHSEAVEIELGDAIRADRSFETGVDEGANLWWVYDKWFGQAYGVQPQNLKLKLTPGEGRRPARVQYVGMDGQPVAKLAPGETYELRRNVFPERTLLQLQSLANKLQGTEQSAISISISDPAGPVDAADVSLSRGDKQYGNGRTNALGKLSFDLPHGDYALNIVSSGRGEQTQKINIPRDKSLALRLPELGYVVAKVTNTSGGPIPCKVQFRGRDGTPDPFFFIDSGEHAVQNLYYSQNGSFRQGLAPGTYDVIISYGIEHDAVFTQIKVIRGQETPLQATLKRTVETHGWVSSDFHSHSTPSGDNTSSQLGRVLNLLCEHIEFAPCTEHNRVSTYIPHLKRLGVEKLMATCSGMELTGSPLPVNHQNAFPLEHKPHTQDGGGPRTDTNPTVQIERLAMWDHGSDKLVQQNHPNIVQMLVDRDLNSVIDQGFSQSFAFMDVIEVHPPHMILQRPQPSEKLNSSNRIFNWLQMLNLGYRIPGVVNTDAHYNFHGSGFLRNYIKSSTDDTAKIDTMEMVHSSEHGNLIMTNGPFLEVEMTAKQGERVSQATAGDDIAAPAGETSLHIRVQCPNWFTVDRVQIFLNGVANEKLNFTRRTHPAMFNTGVIKFDQEMGLKLDGDTHLIVAAAGEQSRLGATMGPSHENDIPIAVSNPIFVDVDGNGFQANGDTLGLPLPVKNRPHQHLH